MTQNSPLPPSPPLYIVGTALGVGKTVLAVALARALQRRGLSVFAAKPVETGCALEEADPALRHVDGMNEPLDAESRASLNRLAELAGPPPAHFVAQTPPVALIPRDTTALLAAARSPLLPHQLNLFRYQPPLEPAVCGRLVDREVQVDAICRAVEAQGADHQRLILEGCHGLLAPYNAEQRQIELIEALGARTLVVAPSATQSINAVLLLVEALEARGLPLAGVVLNRLDPDPAPEEAANPYQIERFAGDVVLGVLPHFSYTELGKPSFLAKRAEVHFDLDRLFQLS